MLIVGLDSHDIIIGRNFFDYFRILIDVHHRRLQWPQEFPPAKTYARTMATYSRDHLRPQRPSYQFQQDMLRRDQAIAHNDKRRQDGVHIRLLTHDLVQSLPTKTPRGVTKTLPKNRSPNSAADSVFNPKVQQRSDVKLVFKKTNPLAPVSPRALT